MNVPIQTCRCLKFADSETVNKVHDFNLHVSQSATGGRVTVVQTHLPTVGAGALKSREDPNERAGKVSLACYNIYLC